jgi:hypothetical protein
MENKKPLKKLNIIPKTLKNNVYYIPIHKKDRGKRKLL